MNHIDSFTLFIIASAQYLLIETPATSAAAFTFSFSPFGSLTIRVSTFSDRYFSLAFALAGVIPLYFPIIQNNTTRTETAKDRYRQLTCESYANIISMVRESHTNEQ